MKSKSTVSSKKHNVAIKDLKAKKNPKGGGGITISGTAPRATISSSGAILASRF